MSATRTRDSIIGVLFVAAMLAIAPTRTPRAADLQGDPARYTGKLEDRKKVCMIQDTVQPRDGIEYAYNGKKYYLCCMGCVAGFQKQPARYSRRRIR